MRHAAESVPLTLGEQWFPNPVLISYTLNALGLFGMAAGLLLTGDDPGSWSR